MKMPQGYRELMKMLPEDVFVADYAQRAARARFAHFYPDEVHV